MGQQFAPASCRTRANRIGLPYAFCGAILCEVDTSTSSIIVVPVDGPCFEYPEVLKSLNTVLDGTPKGRLSDVITSDPAQSSSSGRLRGSSIGLGGYVAASFLIRNAG